jgi:hypothetical protein
MPHDPSRPAAAFIKIGSLRQATYSSGVTHVLPQGLFEVPPHRGIPENTRRINYPEDIPRGDSKNHLDTELENSHDRAYLDPPHGSGRSADGIGTGGDANAENTTVGGTATGGNANTGVGECKGKCTINTGNATGGNASADAINQGDATAVGGDGTGTGGTVSKQEIKDKVKKELKAKLGK